MSVQHTIRDLFAPSRLASTGYRFGMCVVVGCLVGVAYFLLGRFFFWIYHFIK